MIYLVGIGIYLLVLTGISLYKSRQVKTAGDFSVAGRTLRPWVLVCTMLAAWIGTGSIVGNAGKTYEVGLAAIIIPLGSVLGMMLLTRLAPRARAFEAFSVPEIISQRYGALARGLSVIALVIAYMVIVSYQFNAGGAVLQVIFTDETGQSLLSAETATIIAAGFIICYTMSAGLMSLAWADVVTGLIITGSLLVGLPVLWNQAGGVEGMEKAFAAMGRPEHMEAWGVFSWVEIVNFLLPPFLLILGDANQYQRFFASRDVRGARQAANFMVIAILVVECLIILEAWVASSLIPDAATGRYVLIYAAKELMPPALGVFFLIAVVGIIISTADSFLLVPATSVIRDVYMRYVRPNAGDRETVLVSRLLVLVFGIIGWLISLMFARSTTIFEKALYAYTIYGSAITPSLVAALFWKGATRQGALASILTGTLVALLWSELDVVRNALPGSLSGLDAVLPAATSSILVLVAVSLLTQRRER